MGEGSRIRVVDLSAFTSVADIRERKRMAGVLAECCRLNGCVGITGHGVPMELLERAFCMSKRFFELPLADKLKAPHPEGVTPHRGYSGIGKEQAGIKGALDTNEQGVKDELLKTLDYKESYEIGSDENREDYNIWLPEQVLPGFREFITHFY